MHIEYGRYVFMCVAYILNDKFKFISSIDIEKRNPMKNMTQEKIQSFERKEIEKKRAETKIYKKNDERDERKA